MGKALFYIIVTLVLSKKNNGKLNVFMFYYLIGRCCLMTNSKEPNSLIHEKSPYLLQHAYNPVNWYSWNDEAFETAKREDKPIFLSIGYSTCHWCHVMERESFEDEEVAELLNKYFVAIKVDREERPDIDHIYMSVCQALTGHGGWPLTIIMTPDKKPYFAGTYFPKEDRRGHPGLMTVLLKTATFWVDNREEVLATGDKIIEALKPNLNQFVAGEISEELLHKGHKLLNQNFDSEYGGFYGAPKFPSPQQYIFLLRYYKKYQEENALWMVEKSLQSMYNGGIYDHLGYGFARYSTDKIWLVPHFEKMLYDNALLAFTYLEAYQATKDREYANVAEEIFRYVLRDMQDKEGGFYSAEDADSEGVEGKFYVWSKSEIIDLLGTEEGELFCKTYDITDRGNFEGANIPNLIHTNLSRIAEELGLSEEELRKRLNNSKETLFNAREKRIHPYKDDKILTSWNGLMIAALAKGAQVLQKSEYSVAADKGIRFILNNMRKENGRLLARYRDGEAAYLAYLDDYAFMIWGLIEQYEATFDSYYLKVALELNQQMKELFWDSTDGGYFFYGEDGENLFARPKEIYDGAMPSGNSVAALNLIRLARLTGDPELEKDAEAQVKAFVGTVKEYPAGYAYFLMGLSFVLGPTKEIVIAGEESDSSTMAMLEYLQTEYIPEAVLLFHPTPNGEGIKEIVPYVREQKSIDNKATAYVCENFACQSPTTDIEQLKKTIKA